MMKKMTAREALYNVCVALGPIPETNRDDNLTAEEVKLRDSIRVLQNFVLYRETDSLGPLVSPSGDDGVHVRPRGDGKDRIEQWKKEWKLK